MSVKALVHVIGGGRSGLAVALKRALEPEARVRAWESFPRLSEIGATDIVVADLPDFPSRTNPDQLRNLIDCADLWLVVEDSVGYSEFLKMLAGTTVHVLSCTLADRNEGFSRIARALNEKLRGPPVHDIAELVLSKEPVLHVVGDLVRTICARPRDIRHPRDLARACGLRLTALKRCIVPIGFTRVEHFIVAVRTVAYEQLVAQRKLPIQIARRLSGITDPSNHRRELGRALKNSPTAASRLASFAAALLFAFLLTRTSGCAKKAPAASLHESVHTYYPRTRERPCGVAIVYSGSLIKAKTQPSERRSPGHSKGSKRPEPRRLVCTVP
jgi:hypothetical protein